MTTEEYAAMKKRKNNREYYLAHKEKILEYRRKYRQKNRDRLRQYEREYKRRTRALAKATEENPPEE